MRRLTLGLAALLLACTPGGGPEAPGQVVAERATAVLAGFAAPGDTLRYTISWTAGARAASYRVTTTVTQGSGWSGMLTAAPVPGLSTPFTPVNVSAWDSVSFSACVVSVNGSKTSTPTCTAWKLIRSPGAPGPVVVDSSLVIAAVILKPDSTTLALTASAQFCPYFRALDGKVRFASGYEELAVCQGYYDAMPPADRLPGYPVALSAVPRTFQLGDGLTVAVGPARQELARVLFAGPFS